MLYYVALCHNVMHCVGLCWDAVRRRTALRWAGVAKLESLADTVGQTGFKGTPAFMSPEQLQVRARTESAACSSGVLHRVAPALCRL